MQTLNVKGKTYISARRAAEISGYATDYVTQLCRGKKIEGEMVGRSWYVDEESLLNHKKTYAAHAQYYKKNKKGLVSPNGSVALTSEASVSGNGQKGESIQTAVVREPVVIVSSQEFVPPTITAAKAEKKYISISTLRAIAGNTLAVVIGVSLITGGYYFTESGLAQTQYKLLSSGMGAIATSLARKIDGAGEVVNNAVGAAGLITLAGSKNISSVFIGRLADVGDVALSGTLHLGENLGRIVFKRNILTTSVGAFEQSAIVFQEGLNGLLGVYVNIGHGIGRVGHRSYTLTRDGVPTLSFFGTKVLGFTYFNNFNQGIHQGLDYVFQKSGNAVSGIASSVAVQIENSSRMMIGFGSALRFKNLTERHTDSSSPIAKSQIALSFTGFAKNISGGINTAIETSRRTFTTVQNTITDRLARLFYDGEAPPLVVDTRTSTSNIPADSVSVSVEPLAPREKPVSQKPITYLERVTERIIQISNDGITEGELTRRIQELDNKLSSKIYSLAEQTIGPTPIVYNQIPLQTQVAAVERQVALSNQIDKLNGVTITDSSLNGSGSINVTGGISAGQLSVTDSAATSTISGGLETALLSVTSESATSTFANGIAISSGCISVNGTCVGSGSGTPGGSSSQIQFNSSGSFGGSSSLVWDNANKFLGIGTTSPYAPLSVYGEIVGSYFTATSTATSTLAGGLDALALNITGSNATSTFANGIKLTTGCFAIGDTCVGSGSGTVNTGTAGYFTYYPLSDTTVDDQTVLNISGSNIGIGTSSPYSTLSVGGRGVFDRDVRADYFTATSTTLASTFPYASSTALTVSGTAYIGSLNGPLQANNGKVSATTSVGVLYGGTGVTTFGGTNTLLYTSSADTLTSLATANDSILITNGSGVPSWATTLPAFTLGGAVTGNSQAITGLSQLTVTGTTATSTFATGGLTVGTDKFVVQQTSGNVGIGTTSPYAPLSVYGEIVGSYFTATSTATSTLAGGLDALALNITGSNATSTFANGIKLTTGCFAIGDTCVGGGSGSGTVNTGTANQLAYYAAGGTAVSGTSNLAWDNSNTLLGVGTSTPYSRLTVWGGGTGTGKLAEFVNNASTTLFSFLDNGTAYFVGNVGIGTTSPYAKLSVMGEGVFTNISATSTAATSTIAGGLNVGSGALQYDFSSGVTSVDNLSIGSLEFGADAGVVSWADFPVTSAANNVAQSYTAQIDSNPLLTIYAESDGSGGIKNQGVSVGTTSPYAKLSVWANGTSETRRAFEVNNSASTTLLSVSESGIVKVHSTSATTSLSGFLEVLGTGTNATSTISSNLWVKGTLRAGVSYVGDLFFANMFSFTEGELSPTSTQKLFLNNQHGENLLTVFDNGNVGIGTTSPEYKLHVMGDVAATSFVNISTKTAKKDIQYLAPDGTQDFLDKLRGLKLATYRYNNESATSTPRLGLIAEDSPAEILSVDGKGVDIYKLASLILGGVQAQAKQLDSIEMRLLKLEESIAAGNGGSQSGILTYLESLGAKLVAGVASFKNVIAEKLTVGSPTNKTGITLYDEVTGAPYCLSVSNGAPKTTAGECSAVEGASRSNDDSSRNGNGNQADTEPPVITLSGNNPAKISKGTTYVDFGASVTDNVNNNLGVTMSGDSIDTSLPGTYTVTFTATDQAGNTATTTRSVIVEDPAVSQSESNESTVETPVEAPVETPEVVSDSPDISDSSSETTNVEGDVAPETSSEELEKPAPEASNDTSSVATDPVESNTGTDGSVAPPSQVENADASAPNN